MLSAARVNRRAGEGRVGRGELESARLVCALGIPAGVLRARPFPGTSSETGALASGPRAQNVSRRVRRGFVCARADSCARSVDVCAPVDGEAAGGPTVPDTFTRRRCARKGTSKRAAKRRGTAEKPQRGIGRRDGMGQGGLHEVDGTRGGAQGAQRRTGRRRGLRARASYGSVITDARALVCPVPKDCAVGPG